MNSKIKIKNMYKRGRYYYLSCSDGKEYKFEPEIYFKYNLTENTELDRTKFLAVINENSSRLCMNSAIKMLAQRMHCENELKQKLKNKGYSFSIISQVSREAKEMNLLNDEIFTKNYIDELIAKGQGKYKIISSLLKRGISREMIDDKLDELNDSESEEKRAEEILNRKLKTFTGKNIEPYKLKQKLARHLLSKGSTGDIVFKIIDKLK